MKKSNVLKNPTRAADVMSFDELYDDISNNLALKIEQFQYRQRKKLLHAEDY